MEQKLVMAMRAKLPLIAASTTDTLHILQVLEYLLKEPVSFRQTLAPKDIPKLATRYVVVGQFEGPLEVHYRELDAHARVALYIGPDNESPLFYEAGPIPTPTPMVIEALRGHTEAPEDYLPLVGGLTLKDLREVIRLTLARDETLTPRGLSLSRQQYAGKLRGIEPVSLDLPYYREDPMLEKWVALNGPFFLDDELDERLSPRGVLLAGQPGVGKTLGAKRIAAEFGVPLYRLDLSGMMSKWLGDAEKNLRRALNQIEQEAPCVMLIDEVEKAFRATSNGQETVSRILGHLLWWLQERTARVLVVMTTNDLESLPPEIYRAGRIDKVLTMPKLSGAEALEMSGQLMLTFALDEEVRSESYQRVQNLIVIDKPTNGSKALQYSHAEVTQLVLDSIKASALDLV